MQRSLTTLFLSLAATTAAGDFQMAMPIACTLGEDCYIQQTVDHDPTDGATDFTCGPLTYDTHQGTDFALPTLADLAGDVDVLAVAPGVVAGVRNDMSDALQVGVRAPVITGRECGNGVVIQHDDGWETQYCHLAQGSVAVARGDVVTAGTVLGHVGLSGQTQFPHLHLSVRHNGAVVDPFIPDGQVACGAPTGATLWADDIPFVPGGLITAGFSIGLPDYNAIKAGAAAERVIGVNDPLVLWGFAFGGRVLDTIHVRIEGPTGHVLDQSVALEKTQSRLFRATGRQAPDAGWEAGQYTGEVQMIRDGAILDTAFATVMVR